MLGRLLSKNPYFLILIFLIFTFTTYKLTHYVIRNFNSEPPTQFKKVLAEKIQPQPSSTIALSPTLPARRDVDIGLVITDYTNSTGELSSLERDFDGKITTISIYKQFGLPTNNMIDPLDFSYLKSHNITLLIAWEPWDPRQGENQSIDYLSKIASGDEDDYIKQFANAVKSYGAPVTIRFAHEMNGNWYSWSNIDNNTPGDYVAMWKHVHNIFADEGATNAIWVWSPNNIDEKGSTDSILSYYPGDAYVDWVAYSGFNWGNSTIVGWKSFAQISASIYPILLQLDKPIMVAETSSVSSANPLDKIEWFENLANTLPTLPNIKAIVFYNDNYKGSNFKILSGMDTKETFNKNVVNNPYFIKIPLFNQNSQLSSQNHPVAVSF